MKTLFFLICLSLPLQLFAYDLSKDYEKLKNQNFTSQELEKLKSYRILIIPGVLAESFNHKSDNQIKVGFIFEEGFREQIEFMEETKLDYEFLNLETENSPAKNAQIISIAIETSPKPVLIYSHSKGGLDTLEVFRQNEHLLNKVKGWVSVQSPFWGSSIATLMYDSAPLRETGKTLFEWMGGEIGGMKALTIEERKTIMESEETQKLLSKLSKNTKVINYASYKKNTFGIDTPLELFRNITLTHEGENDGVVGIKSALMKEHGLDVDFVLEPGVDHLMTMTRYRPDQVDLIQFMRKNYSQRAHTIGLLKLLLR